MRSTLRSAVLPQKTIDDTDSPYSLSLADSIINVDNGSGSVTINLPAASSWMEGNNSYVFHIKVLEDPTINTVTIDPNGSETIQVQGAPASSFVFGVGDRGKTLSMYSDSSNIFAFTTDGLL